MQCAGLQIFLKHLRQASGTSGKQWISDNECLLVCRGIIELRVNHDELIFPPV